MIDIHCHLLPGIDDGPPDLSTSVAMARMAVADGIEHVVCTPHMTPGVYENDVAGIGAAVQALRARLAAERIDLDLSFAADIHIAPDLLERLDDGRAPCLGASRSFLFEPPHSIMPPGLVAFGERLIEAGYVPILTHPERLRWIEGHYDAVQSLEELGFGIQLTAGSITGRFGSRAKYWSERMLDEGLVDFIATDAHNLAGRPPVLSEARDAIAARLGATEARAMVFDRPAALLTSGRWKPAEPVKVAAAASATPAWLERFASRFKDAPDETALRR